MTRSRAGQRPPVKCAVDGCAQLTRSSTGVCRGHQVEKGLNPFPVVVGTHRDVRVGSMWLTTIQARALAVELVDAIEQAEVPR